LANPLLMTATTADLEKFIKQATPRVEDVRSVDRTDFIRREHGHLNFREVVNSLDALEFSVDSFRRCMTEICKNSSPADAGDTSKSEATAVHGLLRAVDGFSLQGSPSSSSAKKEPKLDDDMQDCTPAAQAKEGWQEIASEAKAAGGECFKSKDFATALKHYTAAIRATPAEDESLSALFSNRSAALLQLGYCTAALADARRCVELKPEWPKGHFRVGCCLSELARFEEAVAAFCEGQKLEPTNKDWERKLEATERLHGALPSVQARQLAWYLLPEVLQAWVRSGSSSGIVHVQVNGELQELGTPKWQLIRDKKELPKAQLRYAYLDDKGYLANLAANLQKPPSEGVGTVDLDGQPLKIADVRSFISGANFANFHFDVRHGGKMVAIIGRIACDDEVRRFVPPHKDPPPPKGSVEGVLQVQARSGFPKALPKLLGFQALPGGDLNFPVVDLDRDAPGAVPVAKEA
jgi:tetratricopeptide (TPR) repeat protein